ncbi:hypothetical protein KKH43_01250 [Patescibacteria group bacterium]|nr:hypothetical protein [Patescibacteria group bacterium]
MAQTQNSKYRGPLKAAPLDMVRPQRKSISSQSRQTSYEMRRRRVQKPVSETPQEPHLPRRDQAKPANRSEEAPRVLSDPAPRVAKQPEQKTQSPHTFKKNHDRETKRPKRGRRFFGTCSVLLALNIIVLGVLIYYVSKVARTVEAWDTEDIKNHITETLNFQEEAPSQNDEFFNKIMESSDLENAVNTNTKAE